MVAVKEEPDVVELLSSDDEDDDDDVVEVLDTPPPAPPVQETWTSPYAFGDDDVQPLPHDQALKKRFPIGCVCRVLADDYSRTACYITGEIVQVAFPWTERSTDFYKVRYSGEETQEWWKESDLEYAPQTPVWFYPNNNHNNNTHSLQDRKAAIVMGTEYYPAETEVGLEAPAAVLHSLRIVTAPHTHHHGIPAEQVHYRFPDEPIPEDKPKIVPKIEVKQEQAAVKAEPAY